MVQDIQQCFSFTTVAVKLVLQAFGYNVHNVYNVSAIIEIKLGKKMASFFFYKICGQMIDSEIPKFTILRLIEWLFQNVPDEL